ncbi:MAG: hypothetical protein AAGE38_15500, partial [Pseudomonadota bacterium]
ACGALPDLVGAAPEPDGTTPNHHSMNRPAPHRVGHPMPLILHLSTALGAYTQAVLAAPLATDPAFPWHPGAERYDGPPLNQLDVAAEALSRLVTLADGIEAWQCHPYRRTVVEPPTLWQQGEVRVLDYGQCPEATDPAGPIVLVVPSLINRAYVLDLMQGNSILRAMASAGLRPLLLDWGTPGAAELRFDMHDYMSGPLSNALALAHGLGGQPAAVLGYCMGGTMCAGHALTLGGMRRLVTIGAPWDFTAGSGTAQALRGVARAYGALRLRQILRGLSQVFGAVPAAVFQHLFSLVDPIQVSRKFQAFQTRAPDSQAATLFTALEDWLADGVPMSGRAAETLLIDWHLDNTPIEGLWPALPRSASPVPTLVVCGQNDRIAQPDMASGLLTDMPHARALRPALGHVGMIVGGQAPDMVWQPVVAFLRESA